jgi:spore germination protein PE
MLQRISSVDRILVNSVSSSSNILIGDSERIFSFSRALAVQREAEIFFDEEGNFDLYKVFSEPISLPALHENINMASFNEKPLIKVETIEIAGISASSTFQVGSTAHIANESRIIQIRHLLASRHPELGNSY